jgi:nucleoside-diphosphate kinase
VGTHTLSLKKEKYMKTILCSLLTAALTLTGAAFAAESEGAKVQQTLSIIKPDAVEANHVGAIIAKFESAGLHVAAIRMEKLSKEKAEAFYAVHKERPFFNDLTTFMSSGPIVAMVLEGDNAIAKNREIMGATDPKEAAAGTIRSEFAGSKTKNAVHGSDSPETAKEEIAFFFRPSEIFSR